MNWFYSTPDEFGQKIYDFKTELYFVGKLFETIIKEFGITAFAYNNILNLMLQRYEERIDSFFDVSRMIMEGNSSYTDFNELEKDVYREFAVSLSIILVQIEPTTDYFDDIEKIIQALDKVYQSSMLEEYVINVVDITRCFLKGGYKYHGGSRFEVITLLKFINLLKGATYEKQRILMLHIWKRLDSIPRIEIVPNTDDLPF